MATATSDLRPAPRPRLPPCSSPPTRVSSTSTSPLRRSRSDEPSPCESGAASSTPSARSRSPTGAEASWLKPHSSPRSCTRQQRTKPSAVYEWWKIVPVVTDTRRLQRSHQNRPSPSANSFRGSAGKRNRLASAANQDSRDRRHHRETTRTTRHSHAGNRDRPESRGRKLLRHPTFCAYRTSDGHPFEKIRRGMFGT